MSTLAVRVSEDPHRPLGHAIVTIDGLPHTLETFVFALNRHGFTANHLGPDGWQGAECWLQPEEAWYDGDSLKFVINPDLVFQLENMPYQMAVRGQGLDGTAAVTFVWPLELAIEEDTTTTTRRLVVSGARVGSRPKAHPQPSPAPVLPEVRNVDLPIPDLPIPEIGGDLEYSKLPEDELPTRVVAHEARHSPSDTDAIRDAEPTRRVDGRIVSTPLDSEERVFGKPTGMPEVLVKEFRPPPSPPSPAAPSPPASLAPSAPPVAPPPPGPADESGKPRGKTGHLFQSAGGNQQSSNPGRRPGPTRCGHLHQAAPTYERGKGSQA